MLGKLGLAPSNASALGGSKARTPVAAPQWELVGLRVRARVRVRVGVGVGVRVAVGVRVGVGVSQVGLYQE